MTLPKIVISLCVGSILGSSAFSAEQPKLPVETGKWYYFVFPQYTKVIPKIRINPKDPFMYVKVLEVRGNWVKVHAHVDKESAIVAYLLEVAESEDQTLLDDYLEFSKMTKEELAEKLSTVGDDDIKATTQWINLSLVQMLADFAAPKKLVEGSGGQPDTVPAPAPEGDSR